MPTGAVEQIFGADQSDIKGRPSTTAEWIISFWLHGVILNLFTTPSLQEERYRRQVAEARDFISRLLSLLERPGQPETKILLLRIVATIGESDRNKIEIGKQWETVRDKEGYSKWFSPQLLMPSCSNQQNSKIGGL